MADRNQDEYKPVEFYRKNTKPIDDGFSTFQDGDDYYFCRYIDGDIAMISQAYSAPKGRDNGIESVKKNEKIASRYKYETRGSNTQGFGLRAGNGQEIAISPNYKSLDKAQTVVGRLSGEKTAGQFSTKKTPLRVREIKSSKTSVKKPFSRKVRARKVPARKNPIKTSAIKRAAFTGQDSRVGNYKPLAFYDTNGGSKEGFNTFEKHGAYYFHYVKDGKTLLISESYTSKRGRDNGIASVKKNMGLKSAYKYRKHKNGKSYFDLYAANGQEIATSRWYTTRSSSVQGATVLASGLALAGAAKAASKTKPKKKTATKKKTTKTSAVKTTTSKATTTKSATAKKTTAKKAPVKKAPVKKASSDEDNYPPLAFYKRQIKGKKKGFEKFHGDDGEYYFTYFENSKLALISEGYPTAAVRDKGVASVEKNIKIEKRYVQGTGADGKPGFILRAGNHKEIARSVGYGSAAAAVTGAAYLMGAKKRTAPKKPAPKKPVAKKPAAPKTPVAKKKTVKAAAPLAAASVVAAGIAAKTAKPKATPVKTASVPVKAAPLKAAPVKAAKAVTPVVPLAAGAVAVAGLTAAAAKKVTAVKKVSVPVKAGALKKVAAKAAPIAAAPVAAAVLGTAAVGAAAVKAVAPEPKAAPVAAAAAVPVAAEAAPVAAATTGGGGIWGWLKWLLLALLALLALLFLLKSCVGGETAVKVPPVVTESAAPPVMVTCWNGDKAETNAACPTKVTCWDNSFSTSLSTCPAKPVVAEVDCWDGSKAADLAACPVKPAPKTIVEPVKALGTFDRICGRSSDPLFNVTRSTPKSVAYLGSNPEFGNSLGLSPNAFFNRLETQYLTNSVDKVYLDNLARSLGYGGFTDMDASMFTNETLPKGTSGLLGFSTSHKVQFSRLDVTDPTHLEAFRVRSANGVDVHFMKRCGNYMYVCQP